MRVAIGLTIGAGNGVGGGVSPSDWILATGIWRDVGVWDDTAVWKDT